MQIRPLRTAGDRSPLFLITDSEAASRSGHLLLDVLDARVPVYLLELDPHARWRTLQGMASGVLRELRAIRPRGPYRLVGWAEAGLLAYEVAIQLIGIDDEVAFLGLVETEPPSWERRQEQLLVRRSVAAPQREKSLTEAAQDYDVETLPVCVHWFGAQGAAPAWQEILAPDRLRVALLPDRFDEQAGVSRQSAFGRALAEALVTSVTRRRTPAETQYQALWPIQSGRSGCATEQYFCVPGAGATVTDFVPLAAELGPEYTLHGFQSRGLSATLVPHTSVEVAARAYLRELERLCPHGDVHLVGHSFGGWIAFEMTRLLQARGRTVRSLTLLDSEVPGEASRVGQEYTRPEALMLLVSLYEQAAQRSTGLTVEDFEACPFEAQLALLHRHLVQLGLMPVRLPPASLIGTVRAFEAAVRTSYVPGGSISTDTRLVLVREVEEPEDVALSRMHAVTAGWRRLAPNLSERREAGNHVTLLRPPYIGSVASWMLSLGGEESSAVREVANYVR